MSRTLWHPPRLVLRISLWLKASKNTTTLCVSNNKFSLLTFRLLSTNVQKHDGTRSSNFHSTSHTSASAAPIRFSRRFNGSPIARTMSSDADYAAFLEKANEGTGAVEQQSSSKKGYGTSSVNTAVPKALEKVEEYYTSDADEPFEPVALKFDGSSVSAGKGTFHARC